MLTQPGVTGASASRGACRPSPPSCSRGDVGAGPTETEKPHKASGAEQTGFTELLSSQAPVPCTTLVARSLSQGLWAGKYGFMCAHITFGSREAFKSNYGKCYLHELLFEQRISSRDFCQNRFFWKKKVLWLLDIYFSIEIGLVPVYHQLSLHFYLHCSLKSSDF